MERCDVQAMPAFQEGEMKPIFEMNALIELTITGNRRKLLFAALNPFRNKLLARFKLAKITDIKRDVGDAPGRVK